MAKDWTAVLVQVLIDRGRVSLPGVGTFALEASPAVVDPIGNKVQPPGSQISLNENLVLDDGQLVQYLRDHHQMSAEEARLSVQDYAQSIVNRIVSGEQVSLEGLGVLRKNFEGKVQFTAVNKNLSKDYFGLPEVPVETLVRRQPATTTTTEANTVQPTGLKPKLQPTLGPKPLPNPQSDAQEKRKRLIIWLAGATLLLVVAGFLIDRLSSSETPTPPVANDPAEEVRDTPDQTDRNEDAFTRLPTGAGANDEQTTDTYQPDPATIGEAAPAITDEEETSSTIDPSTAATTKQAVIAVGQYGQQANVDRASRRIRNAGYELYTQQVSGLTRVGARVNYTSETDLDQVLSQVRQRLGVSDAFILIKDGRNLLYD